MLIGEAARLGNLSQRSTGIAQQGLRSLHSPVKQELIGRLPGTLAETPNEVRCARLPVTDAEKDRGRGNGMNDGLRMEDIPPWQDGAERWLGLLVRPNLEYHRPAAFNPAESSQS